MGTPLEVQVPEAAGGRWAVAALFRGLWCHCRGNAGAAVAGSGSRAAPRGQSSAPRWAGVARGFRDAARRAPVCYQNSLCCTQAFPSSFYFNDIFLQEKCWVFSNNCKSVFEIKISFLWRLSSLINELLCWSAKEDIHIFQKLKEHINNWSCVLSSVLSWIEHIFKKRKLQQSPIWHASLGK